MCVGRDFRSSMGETYLLGRSGQKQRIAGIVVTQIKAALPLIPRRSSYSAHIFLGVTVI